MKVKYVLVLVLILSFWAVKPLLGKGLFPIHDETQVGRIMEMAKALSEGSFPVRWSDNLGYGAGYPLFNFYAPLPYYAGGLVLLLFQDIILATKIMYALGIIFSGIFIFILVREFIGVEGALVSAVLYMYAPYHAVQIYVRGAVGEYWAYGLLPAVVWGFYKIIKTKKTKYISLSAILISALILSHNIISLLFVALFALIIFLITIYLTITKGNFRNVFSLFISLIIGLLLSSFFWLPAIFESKYTDVSSITMGGSQYRDHFLYLDQLWDSPWGFAGSAPGREDGMSFKLGKIQIILGFLGLSSIYFLKLMKKINQTDFIFANLIIVLLFSSVLMTLPISLPIWDLGSPALKFVQFPWRFLVFVVFSLAFLSGYSLKLTDKKNIYYVFLVFLIIFLTISINSKYFQPQYFLSLTNNDYKREDYLKWEVSRISDEYLPKGFIKPQTKESVARSLINEPVLLEYKVIEQKTGKIRFILDLVGSKKVVFNRTYFPGWLAFIDGKYTEVKNNHGLLSLDISSGTHEVVLLLKNTPIRIVGDTLTVFAFLGILLVQIKRYGYEKSHR